MITDNLKIVVNENDGIKTSYHFTNTPISCINKGLYKYLDNSNQILDSTTLGQISSEYDSVGNKIHVANRIESNNKISTCNKNKTCSHTKLDLMDETLAFTIEKWSDKISINRSALNTAKNYNELIFYNYTTKQIKVYIYATTADDVADLFKTVEPSPCICDSSQGLDCPTYNRFNIQHGHCTIPNFPICTNSKNSTNSKNTTFTIEFRSTEESTGPEGPQESDKSIGSYDVDCSTGNVTLNIYPASPTPPSLPPNVSVIHNNNGTMSCISYCQKNYGQNSTCLENIYDIKNVYPDCSTAFGQIYQSQTRADSCICKISSSISSSSQGNVQVKSGDSCGKIAVNQCGASTHCYDPPNKQTCPVICNAENVCDPLHVGATIWYDCSVTGKWCTMPSPSPQPTPSAKPNSLSIKGVFVGNDSYVKAASLSNIRKRGCDTIILASLFGGISYENMSVEANTMLGLLAGFSTPPENDNSCYQPYPWFGSPLSVKDNCPSCISCPQTDGSCCPKDLSGSWNINNCDPTKLDNNPFVNSNIYANLSPDTRTEISNFKNRYINLGGTDFSVRWYPNGGHGIWEKLHYYSVPQIVAFITVLMEAGFTGACLDLEDGVNWFDNTTLDNWMTACKKVTPKFNSIFCVTAGWANKMNIKDSDKSCNPNPPAPEKPLDLDRYKSDISGVLFMLYDQDTDRYKKDDGTVISNWIDQTTLNTQISITSITAGIIVTNSQATYLNTSIMPSLNSGKNIFDIYDKEQIYIWSYPNSECDTSSTPIGLDCPKALYSGQFSKNNILTN